MRLGGERVLYFERPRANGTGLERYVDGPAHTKEREDFWSLLKRGLKETCVVLPANLDSQGLRV